MKEDVRAKSRSWFVDRNLPRSAIFVSRYSGFSLGELMIAVAIIGIMSVVSFSALMSNKTGSRLGAAQREVAATIKQAQSYALQGKTLPDGTATPVIYGVHFIDDRTYEIYYCKESDCSDSTRLQSYSLKEGVTATPVSADARFTLPFGTVTLSETPLTITLSFFGDAKTVIVTSGGAITED